ncbi:hypothetical protein L484_026713 [Morus notabilis]|uniref:Uncharacterized protein n=1 Tax=Morus notabilis TaxID=981085 RepID=W9SCU1_9ROSA|nr:hypothetical protein L484_026713 [Morus notabilis]
MASDFEQALQLILALVFVGLWAFFIWQVIVMVIKNPDGDPTLKELIVAFFRGKKTSRRQLPSDQQKNKNTEPPPLDLV